MGASQEIASIAANLMVNELLPRLKKNKIGIESSPISAEKMAEFAILKYAGFSTREIRKLMDAAFDSPR